MSEHEFETKTEVTYRGFVVPVEYHNNLFDDEQLLRQRAFKAGVDLVLDWHNAFDSEPKTLNTKVYAPDPDRGLNNAGWHVQDDKALYFDAVTGQYEPSCYSVHALSSLSGVYLIGVRYVDPANFRLGSRP